MPEARALAKLTLSLRVTGVRANGYHELDARVGHAYEQFIESLDVVRVAGTPYSAEDYRAGRQTPVFFGSALTNFGLEPFLRAIVELAPPPQPRPSSTGLVLPTDERFTGFVFKIQANMDRAHRDRLAMLRICSGRFERGMKVLHVRTGRELRLTNPTQFVAQERTVVDEAFAGDVIGIFDPGIFEIGDTLTEGSKIAFEGIPSFAPEHFARIAMVDSLKRKQLVRQFEKRLLDEEAHYLMTLQWHRIIPHSSKLKGWTVTPSHYLNNTLDTVWLEQ